MRILLLGMLLLSASVGLAQKSVSPQKFSETISENDLREHLFILAGKEMEGRETATEGQRKAAAYIERFFRTNGLLPGNKDSYQQFYNVYRDSLVSSTLLVNNNEYQINKDYQPILQLSRTSGSYFSEIVFAGHGIVDSAYDDYGNMDVKGKAVLILDGAPSNFKTTKRGFRAPNGLYGKIAAANAKGAAALLIVGGGFPRQAMPALGNMYVDLYSPQQGANVYTISSKLAEAIVGTGYADLVQQGKQNKLEPKLLKANTLLELNKAVKRLESSNVLGYVEGSDKKDEWLIITAHYDHLGKRGDVIYYGADDDGSGTVGILEIAQAFAEAKKAGKGPRRNVMIMAVSGEEKGLWGSDYFTDNPTIPLDKLTADLNIDMIGRVDTERKSADTLNYIYVVGDDKLSSELKPLSEAANKKSVKMTLDYKFNDPNDTEQIYYRSDHFNFAKNGVPVIFYYDGMLKADYHKPTDTPDKINYPLLKKRAQLVFNTAWEMANRDNMMKRDIPLPEMNRR
jgi:Zn-dependent M28 family amino/carboxypeptidase